MAHSLYVDEARMEPLNLGVLAALTPPDVDVVMYDDRMEPIPYQEATDLVAITVETYTARRSYEIADEYRRRGVRVVMGGFQPTFAPDECARTPTRFIGDAETLWATVVEDARRGELKPIYGHAGAAANRRPDAPRYLRRQGLPAHQPPPLARLPVRLRLLRRYEILRTSSTISGHRRDHARGGHPGPPAAVLRGRQHRVRSRGAQGALSRSSGCASTGSARPPWT